MRRMALLCVLVLMAILAGRTLGGANLRQMRKPVAPSKAEWNAYARDCLDWYIQYPAPNSLNGDCLAGFTIPSPDPYVEGVSLLTTTSDQQVLGNLTGKTLSAEVRIETSGEPEFVFGFEGADWNTCPVPANVRLFFTTTAEPYNLYDANNNQFDYWWSNAGFGSADLANGLDAVISASLADPSQWLDSQGNIASESPYCTASFLAAVRRIRQIGLSFGGACYYDTGVGVDWSDGEEGWAEFTLVSYQVQ